MKANKYVNKAEDLITSREQTRAGFIEAALEKSHKAKPYIEQAKTLKSLASDAETPKDLLGIEEIRNSLLTASGLSDKAFKYFDEKDKTEAITKMIDEFLEPAGVGFVDELVYRFLLIKGDSLGGSMRNYVGAVAEMKLIRKILSLLSMQNIEYKILLKENRKTAKWETMEYKACYDLADEIGGILWNINRERKKHDRILLFDVNIPVVKNNIDICLFRAFENEYRCGQIVDDNDKAIMFGELKGGIDPAGADEHWKTGNTALSRILSSFASYDIKTSFIAAAIEKKMAGEIFSQYDKGILTNVANITVDNQLTEYCKWIINL